MYLSFSFKDILVLIVYLSQFFFDDSSCTNLVFIQLNASFNAYAPPLQERVLIYMFSVLFFYLPCITHTVSFSNCELMGGLYWHGRGRGLCDFEQLAGTPLSQTD